MRPIIALITDYGTKDPYVAQIKAVILRYRDDAAIIDVTHEVESFNELEAAFLMKTYVEHMPPGTIHVCVIDPGVGAGRKGIIIATERGDMFIGPDTGFMIPAARKLGIKKIYVIDESRLPPRTSETFHGRDVFAHVAGRLARGEPPEKVGKETLDYKVLDIPSPTVTDGKIEGRIMHVDKFGNLITNIMPDELESIGKLNGEFVVKYRGGEISCRWVKSYGWVKEGEYLLVEGGTGYIELSINRGNAAEKTGLKVGDKLTIQHAED